MKRTKKSKQWISVLMALCLLLGGMVAMPMKAYAAAITIDLANPGTPVAGDGWVLDSGNTIWIQVPANTYTLIGATTTYRVWIQNNAGDHFNITLNGVSITVSTTGTTTSAPIVIKDCTANITLVGVNTLTASNTTGYPGFGVWSDAELQIGGDGALVATGGNGGAGIGGAGPSGNVSETNGKITIGGNVDITAHSPIGGAGIGSGSTATVTGAITIGGNAKVKATSGFYGAGIGGGRASAASTITISGNAVVEAQGGDASGVIGSGAGIGGGSGNGGHSGIISILDNASVTAIGGGGGSTNSGGAAGIGSGGVYMLPSTLAPVDLITINTTGMVTAIGGVGDDGGVGNNANGANVGQGGVSGTNNSTTPVAGAGIASVTHPTAQTVTEGQTASFTSGSVTAGTNPPTSLAYQWQVSTDGGATFSNVLDGTGGTTASYTTAITTAAMSGYLFRNMVTATGGDLGNGTIIWCSIPASLTVNATNTLTVGAGAGGTVSGTASGNYTAGTSISVMATANSGYHFTGWSVAGAAITGGDTANPATFNMPSNAVTLTANFEQDAPSPSIAAVPTTGNSILVVLGLLLTGLAMVALQRNRYQQA